MHDDEILASFLTWLSVEKGRSTNTLDAYRRDLAGYAEWRSARGLSLLSVSANDVDEFVSARSAVFASSTVARQLAAVRMLHSYLVRSDVRADDPCGLLEGVKVPIGVPKPLNEAEVAALLASVTGTAPTDLRDRALLEFLYSTGARISEVCGLNLDDLSMDGGVVRLFGKGAKERLVPFGEHARSALGAYLGSEGRPSLCPPAWRSTSDRDAVFLTKRGLRLTRQKAWSIVRKAGHLAGISRDLSPHVLRHSCATHMLEHGADLRIVQEMLGHATISTTQVYTRVSPDHLLSVYRASHPRERSIT